MMAVVTLGFVKDAMDHVNIQGFNVYHKNRLIKVSIVLASAIICVTIFCKLHHIATMHFFLSLIQF